MGSFIMNYEDIIVRAIAEDQEGGDHTSLATIPSRAFGKGYIAAKEDGILSGTTIAKQVFKHIDPEINIRIEKPDGSQIYKGDILLRIEGRSISILRAERISLNFLQRMSGIATNTQQYVRAVKDYPAGILDTRKTTPLMRQFEKKAVADGGGYNHRMGLYDMIMIKDNHIDFAGGIPQAINAVEKYLTESNLQLPVVIEARNFDELDQILNHGKVDRIMLDNFTPEELTKAVKVTNKRLETEASGEITLDTVANYAASGVDYISIGALTNHIQSLDINLTAKF